MFKGIYLYLKRNNFRSKLFFVFMKYFLIQLIIFATVTSVISVYLIKKCDEEMYGTNENQIRRIEDMSTMIYTQIDRVCSSLCVDSDAGNFIHAENALINYSLEQRLTERMVHYKKISNCIDSIYIYSPKHKRLLGTNIVCRNETECSEYTDYEFIKQLEANMLNDTWVIPRKIGNAYPRVVSFVKKPIDGGYVIVNISYEKFIEAMSPTFDTALELCILDGDKRIVFPENLSEKELESINSLIAENKKDEYNKKAGVAYSQISIGYFEQSFVIKADISEFSDKKTQIVWISLIALLCFAMISVFIAYFLSSSSIQFVVKLYDVLENKNFDLSDMDESEEKHLMTEIIRLIDDNREFKCMIDKHLEEYNKSQVLALQKQINPHFLNNVLSMISYKIVESGGMQSQALNMIVMLTRIIRYGFNDDTYMVLLREEAGFISDYIKILKEQYGDFQFEMNISDEAYEQKVLRLSIQPFIENAAYHGIHDLKADGKVSLSGEIINERLIIIVEDNGVGIDEQRLAALNNIDDNTVDYSHIGIYNTYRRMKAVYADDVKLKFESDSKSFTRVTIDLPIKK